MPTLLSNLFLGPVLKRFELEVPAVERHLGEIRDFISRVAAEAGFSLNETNNLKLALDEACSNVVRHAYKNMEPGTIRLEVDWRERALEIKIRDQGRGFDWKRMKAPDLNRYVEIGKKGGLGIWFIRKLMDETNYHSTPQGNLLRLVKHIRPVRPEVISPQTTLPAPLEAPERPAGFGRRISVKIKFLLPVMVSVAILVLIIFTYMFRNQATSMRQEIMAHAQDSVRRMSQEAVNYMLKQDDLHLAALVKSAVRTDPRLAYAFILDNADLVWAHSQTQNMFKPFTAPAGFKPVEGKKLLTQTWQDPKQGAIHDLGYPIYLGDVRLGTAHLGLKEEAISQEIRVGGRQAVLIFIVSLIASTSGAYFLMAFLIAPIRKLSDGMLAVSEGRLNHRILIRSNDEFGQIAEIFNDMTRRFSEAQHNLLEQERIQQEMQVAQEIQHALLPREVPQIEGYDVASLYRSAKEVGGDYFDFVNVDDNILGVAIADVSGKGIPGSLVMTMIRTALRMEARGNRSATDVMAKVNNFVTPDMKKGMFVTMFYIVLDSRQRVITFSSAGHNPLILYRVETDKIYYLKPRGFPLGINLPDEALFAKSLTQDHVNLKQGDVLLAYTDGITEAMNPKRQQFGEQRLIQVVRKYHHLSAQEFVDKLSEELAVFTEEYPQNDDITCVVIKEKMMADTVQVNLRRQLFALVEKEGLSVVAACRQLKVSPSTFYRLRRQRDKFGAKRLFSVEAQPAAPMKRMSVEEREKLLALVARDPRRGAKRLSELLATASGGQVVFPERDVYQELKRLRLSTRAQRETYASKKKVD